MDHLQEAKRLIEQMDDSGGEAASHIRAWLAEDSGRTQRQAAEIMGISRQRVGQILTDYQRPGSKLQFASRAEQSHARRALRNDPASVFEKMSTQEVDSVIEAAHEVHRTREPIRLALDYIDAVKPLGEAASRIRLAIKAVKESDYEVDGVELVKIERDRVRKALEDFEIVFSEMYGTDWDAELAKMEES